MEHWHAILWLLLRIREYNDALILKHFPQFIISPLCRHIIIHLLIALIFHPHHIVKLPEMLILFVAC